MHEWKARNHHQSYHPGRKAPGASGSLFKARKLGANPSRLRGALGARRIKLLNAGAKPDRSLWCGPRPTPRSSEDWPPGAAGRQGQILRGLFGGGPAHHQRSRGRPAAAKLPSRLSSPAKGSQCEGLSGSGSSEPSPWLLRRLMASIRQPARTRLSYCRSEGSASQQSAQALTASTCSTAGR